MSNLRSGCWLFALAFMAATASATQAPFTIENLTDKTVYRDSIWFRVPTQVGFAYSLLLDRKVVSAGVSNQVSAADYHELVATRTETATGAVSNRLVRFIVAASERADTEWGLPPHVPFPTINSSAREFTGARVRLMAPSQFPTAYDIPVVGWVMDDQNHAVRVNGPLAASGHPSIPIKRGVGSGFLSATNSAGALNYAAQIGGLATNRAITLESATSWTTVSGLVSSDTSWPANSRIHVTGSLTVPSGVTLTLGAGTVVRLNGGIDITNNGSVVINGSLDQPVVFMPAVRAQPWGGFVSKTLNAGTITATGAIFTGSGANPNWFGAGGNPGSHRAEQALFFCQGGQQINLIDSAAIYLKGQLGHSFSSANATPITLTRFLMQRVSTGGEYTGARFTVNDSAFIECPDDSGDFVDGDNDGLYLVDGNHSFANSLFGWTKDDGIDSGGDGVGRLDYEQCWFEATFHEGNSLSGLKTVTARGTVYLDCGQGIEDGYGAGASGPMARLDRCLLVACQSGIRHGDNYSSTGNGYPGNITAADCIVLHNHRDVFGYNWRSTGWTNVVGQMFITNNFLTAADTDFPVNTTWNPATDGGRLAGFGANGHVGAALAVSAGQNALSRFPDGIPVGLSRFCTNEVAIGYTLDSTDGIHQSGTLTFPSGLTRAYIPLPANFDGVLRVALSNPVNADLTGTSSLLFQNVTPPPGASPTVLSPLGASWRYLDNGSDQGTAWREPRFDDSGWSNGVARLGFGADAAAATTIRRFLNGTSGPQITNFYFRRAFVVSDLTNFAMIQFRYQRDDGCIGYLNGAPVFTNNMPAGAASYRTFAAANVTPQSESLRFWTNTVPASRLHPGTNVIAVEVHQSTGTSSDIAWEMELMGLPAPEPPRLAVSRLGGDVVVFWTDPGFDLEEAEAVTGPWRLATPNSPTILSTSGTRFLRLKK
jgi:hypothetical protein